MASSTPMYTKKKDSSASSSKKDFDKAVAFFNVEIPLPNGQVVKFRKGIPLGSDNVLERSVTNKELSEPGHVFQCTGTVHIVEDNSQTEDYEF